jgi:hypothetical protein
MVVASRCPWTIGGHRGQLLEKTAGAESFNIISLSARFRRTSAQDLDLLKNKEIQHDYFCQRHHTAPAALPITSGLPSYGGVTTHWSVVMKNLEAKLEENVREMNPFGIQVDSPMQKSAVPGTRELKPINHPTDARGFFSPAG